MERVKIVDPEAIQVLMDIAKIRLLAPFMVEARTVAQVAEVTGYSHNALGYWVKRFVRLGLLKEVGEHRPARYQAAAPEFLVDPSRVMPLDDMLDALYRPAWNRLLQGYTREHRRVSEDWYVLLKSSPDGLVTRQEVAAWQIDEPQAPPPVLPLNDWGVIQLSREKARELTTRLSALMGEYFEEGAETPQDDLYVFHLGLARDVPHE